jgi:hypothetical protein
MIKTFFDKLDEASLQGNPGIPGEGGKKGNYLKSAEAIAKAKNREMEARYGREIPQFMGLVGKARAIQSGHEKDLAKAAKSLILSLYGSILDGVELNIKFPEPNAIQKMMQDVPAKPPMDSESLKRLEDEEVISEIQRRKIGNNISQGEAKNVKKVLVMPETLQEFTKIFSKNRSEKEGKALAEEYRDLLIKISDIARLFDWIIPMEVQLEMWERDKSGFSGSVKIEWESPKSEEDEDETKKKAQEIVDELSKSTDIPEEAEEVFNETSPTINAIGTDFSMLIHETVKGIYDLIVAAAIPEDPEIADTVILNTDTLADELEDLRYGPEIAADLRDYLNTFKEASEIENFREHIFGKMMRLDAKEFLELFFKILNQDEDSKDVIKEMAREIKSEISKYELGASGIEIEEPEFEMPGVTPQAEVDYKQMSQKDIQTEVDKALDAEDYDRVKELSKYLKESRRYKVYEKLNAYPYNTSED